VRQSRYRGITTSLPPAFSPGGAGNETDFTQYFQFASKELAIMNKPLLCLAALLIATPAFAEESRMHTTRDSGSYEASLRQAGIPLAGGLAWTSHTSALAARKNSRPAASMVASVAQPTRAN
jgi:hypothetical protein